MVPNLSSLKYTGILDEFNKIENDIKNVCLPSLTFPMS